jgi:hypothetical protein
MVYGVDESREQIPPDSLFKRRRGNISTEDIVHVVRNKVG